LHGRRIVARVVAGPVIGCLNRIGTSHCTSVIASGHGGRGWTLQGRNCVHWRKAARSRCVLHCARGCPWPGRAGAARVGGITHSTTPGRWTAVTGPPTLWLSPAEGEATVTRQCSTAHGTEGVVRPDTDGRRTAATLVEQTGGGLTCRQDRPGHAQHGGKHQSVHDLDFSGAGANVAAVLLNADARPKSLQLYPPPVADSDSLRQFSANCCGPDLVRWLDRTPSLRACTVARISS
jgi:hypothetical protein